MFRTNILRYLVNFCIAFFILSQLKPDIFPQKKDKTTNWPEPNFEHLTIADGLPENSVRCILQDHLGYMWFGTQNGLVKYDGYSMKVYQPDPDDSLSISNRIVWAIYEDRSGTLWIGTDHEGLNRFNRATETFTKYIFNPDDTTREFNVLGIFEDKSGNLFAYEDKSGNEYFLDNDDAQNCFRLYILDRRSEKFNLIYSQDSISFEESGAIIDDQLTGNIYVGVGNKIFTYDTHEKNLVKKDINFEIGSELGEIHSFFQNADGTIWIGHSKGLASFNSLLNTIRSFQPIPSTQYRIENDIAGPLEDENDLLWSHGRWSSSSMGQGLFCFDQESEQFKIYKSDLFKENGLSSNVVWSTYIDRSGVLWVGTGWAGLNKWNRSQDMFKRFSYDSNGKPLGIVYSIVVDKQGFIWFGTRNGLYSFNRHSNEFRNYLYDTNGKDNAVNDIYIDEAGIIWVATPTKGLGRFDRKNESFHFYSNIPDDSLSISINNTTRILPEDGNFLWVGTWDGGVNRFDKGSGNFTRFMHDPNNPQSLSGNQISSIYNDRRGNLWIGLNMSGLNLFNPANQSFKSFKIEDDKSNAVSVIFEDNKENFWVGTYQTGLYLFDRDKGKPVYNITVEDGLSKNVVRSILEDGSGNLWIGTEYGLSRFNPESRRIRNYYTSNILKENKYYRCSACKTSTGEMLFGTSDGFIMFHPDSVKDNPVPPQIVISNVSLFNRPGEKLKFDGFISEMKKLNLSYNENDLRFDYVGLHYADPLKNRYKYKLEGFDKDWVDAGTQRNATYTNLSAGDYIFRVTACNEDGVWNKKGASIKIIIPPPFWATWWAYGFYLFVFVGVLYGIRKYEMNRLNWKNQYKLDEVKLKEREETDKMKSRFFANISHEFRTPLTLILGPIEKILSKSVEDETKKQASLVKRNANRLLGLINQLLELSRLEEGKQELKPSGINIVPFIKGITMSFESVAERKDITLKVIVEKENIKLYIDKERMMKIMTNLLSNAFKFTPEGGEITVTVGHAEFISASSSSEKIPNQVRNDSAIIISVKDTGIGIPEEELPKLFDRFYQVDSSQTREHEGTGIGLALTKELVKLHRGTINVKSKLGAGTEFTIELPVGRKHLSEGLLSEKDEEIVEEAETTEGFILNEVINKNDFDAVKSSDKVLLNENEISEEKNIILIVEDNRDVREFIKDSLGKKFQIEEAANGEQGVRIAEQIIPDLIISDIMMPKMDGNELTRRIKNDERTSHIPVILLTAKSEQESRLEGLETGADDYLTKPFDTKELLVRIKNLINLRRKLQEKFSGGKIISSKGEKKLSLIDEKFLNKIFEISEKHLPEEKFSIKEFSDEAGMSRSQLHRKIKALTGKSPSLYLRSVRLTKAKTLIEEKLGNISEIAYSVGFSSPIYFSRCFKDEFGYPPSELVK